MSGQIAVYSGEEIVKGLYRSILGREPDPDGLKSYAKVLEAGDGVEHVASALMHSAEFRERLGMLSQMLA